jgi:Protein of unknown function (DUF1642)
MTDKAKVARVTLPREVAEAIEEAKEQYESNTAIFDDARNGILETLYYHFEYNFDELMSALVNGYEIEKSPEDKVREYYEFWSERARDRDYETRTEAIEKLNGMMFALNAYGIKIPGVNADA